MPESSPRIWARCDTFVVSALQLFDEQHVYRRLIPLAEYETPTDVSKILENQQKRRKLQRLVDTASNQPYNEIYQQSNISLLANRESRERRLWIHIRL
jgi:hypothetical protein